MYRLPGLPTTDPAATAALKVLRAGAAALPERLSGPPEVRAARAVGRTGAAHRAGAVTGPSD